MMNLRYVFMFLEMVTIFSGRTVNADILHPDGVVVVNELGDNPSGFVDVSCYSDDEDRALGWKQLVYGQEVEWRFRRRWFGGTVYSCYFHYSGHWQRFLVWKDYYKNSKVQLCDNFGVDCSICEWKIRNDGFYIVDVGGVERKCKEWKV